MTSADFAPEPIGPRTSQQWIDESLARAERVFDAIEAATRYAARRSERLLIDELLAQCADACGTASARCFAGHRRRSNIRHHGDFHLGQMLIVKDDIFIIDFEGEPRRTLEERRRKAPAARDVAGLIRSIELSATAALEPRAAGGHRTNRASLPRRSRNGATARPRRSSAPIARP